MKKCIVILLLLFCFTSVAYAHPGRTDEYGGHNETATGEYHYHHGYSAHSHAGGCPYNYDDQTGVNSGKPSSSNLGSGSFFRDFPLGAVLLSVVPSAFLLYMFCSYIAEHLPGTKKEKAKMAAQLKQQKEELERDLLALRSRIKDPLFFSVSNHFIPPPNSYVDENGFLREKGKQPTEDMYYFSLSSTGVYHRPSCRYASFRAKNICEHYLHHGERWGNTETRFCSLCCPYPPDMRLVKELCEMKKNLDKTKTLISYSNRRRR